MQTAFNRDSLQRSIEAQVALAALATNDDVRTMNHELAALYRAQLACVMASELLAPVSAEQLFDQAA
ncbi:hypothetical protein [Sphingomonas melonis]